MKIINEYFVLTNGVKIPKIGFGTWQIKPGDDTYNAVFSALKVGYRHIDTAYAYQNEASVIKAIKDFGLKREDVFITSKLPAQIKDYEGAIKFFNRTLSNLESEYVDLYLIHAPWPWDNRDKDCSEGNVEVFKAMIEFYNDKKVRAIGVSNFSNSDIDNIIANTGFVPHVNQIALFVGKNQKESREYAKKHNILIEAYSPLGIGSALNNKTVIEMAQKYNVSPAQICIRYCLQVDTLPLPKSVHEARMINNIDIDFNISNEDLDTLEQIIDDSRNWQ